MSLIDTLQKLIDFVAIIQEVTKPFLGENAIKIPTLKNLIPESLFTPPATPVKPVIPPAAPIKPVISPVTTERLITPVLPPMKSAAPPVNPEKSVTPEKLATPPVVPEKWSDTTSTTINQVVVDKAPPLREQITNLSITEEIISPPDPNTETKATPPPFISFVTFNRLGLTIKNLNNILDSEEDFEMHIVDCNSKDDSWNYIKSLKDKRIKSKTRFKVNRGPIYVLNYNLTKRKPNQYFFTIDSDVYIKTKNWLAKYMEVFEAFPEVGLLGTMRDKPYPRFLPPIIPKVNGNLSYLQLKNGEIDGIMEFIPGCLQGFRPELFEKIGYWSEECGYGDAEISPRILHYTPFKVGFITTVEIEMPQTIACDDCQGLDICTLSRSVNTCYTLSRKSNVNESFAKLAKWKYLELFKELEQGKRTAYSASILDPESLKNHVYHESWALENFEYYLSRSN